jgi:hypothetical protein
VVHTVNFVAEELKNAADGVTLDCRAQMSHVHVFGNVRGREINKNALLGGFFLLGLFGGSESNKILHVDAANLLLNKVGLEGDVQEETTLGGVSLADLGEINFFDSIILGLIDVVDDSLGHVMAVSETEGSTLLRHVEELHCRGTHVVPFLVTFGLDRYGISEFWHGALGGLSDNSLEMLGDRNH